MDAKVTNMKIEGEGGALEDVQTMGTLEKSKLDWFFNEIFPIRNFYQLLSTGDVRNLRRVCRDWSMTVDNLLELANDIKEPDYNNYKSIISSPIMLSFKNKDGVHEPLVLYPTLPHSSHVARFWSGAERHGRNPFLSRQAYFACLFDDESHFWSQAGAMLEKFGEELRFMKIWFRSQLPREEMFRMVQKCISQTPQLTQLDCCLINATPQGDEPSGVLIPEFPPLPNLTRLSVSFSWCPIFQQLTPYFEQLVSLNVRGEKDFMDLYNPELHSTFPSLKHLGVDIKNEIALVKLHSLTSQLREVDIRGIHSENFSPSIYFHFLEHFKGTLSVVKIDLKFNCDDEEILSIAALGLPDRSKLDLPHLKVLCLTVRSCGFGGLDAILSLTSPPDYLELDVHRCRSGCDVEDDEGAESIQSHPYLEDMYRSNIWVLVPSMQEMVIEHDNQLGGRVLGDRDRYTRGMYEVKKQELEDSPSPKPVKRARYM